MVSGFRSSRSVEVHITGIVISALHIGHCSFLTVRKIIIVSPPKLLTPLRFGWPIPECYNRNRIILIILKIGVNHPDAGVVALNASICHKLKGEPGKCDNCALTDSNFFHCLLLNLVNTGGADFLTPPPVQPSAAHLRRKELNVLEAG